MRRTLIILAVANVFVSLALVFWLSMSGAFVQVAIMDRAHELEVTGAIDYDRLGAMLGKSGRADRYDLEGVMGIQLARSYGQIANAWVLLTVIQTGAIVLCALRITGAARKSAAQAAPPSGDVHQG